MYAAPEDTGQDRQAEYADDYAGGNDPPASIGSIDGQHLG